MSGQWKAGLLFFLLVTLHSSLVTAAALPSLFRGIVVANSELGVRVVRVEEESQAALADLRPEDIIVQVNDTALKTIDEFAEASQALKRRATKATVMVLRNGQPRELLLHLYSYPVLRAWGLQFVPDYDLRFVDPSAALVYWLRMARGFEGAGQLDQALNATLNALHHRPEDVDLAVHAAELLSRIARGSLVPRDSLRSQADTDRAAGMAAMQQATLVMERLFEHPLEAGQLKAIKSQLEATVATLKQRAATTGTPAAAR